MGNFLCKLKQKKVVTIYQQQDDRTTSGGQCGRKLSLWAAYFDTFNTSQQRTIWSRPVFVFFAFNASMGAHASTELKNY
jgi:hypothetical protein